MDPGVEGAELHGHHLILDGAQTINPGTGNMQLVCHSPILTPYTQRKMVYEGLKKHVDYEKNQMGF